MEQVERFETVEQYLEWLAEQHSRGYSLLCIAQTARDTQRDESLAELREQYYERTQDAGRESSPL